MGKYKFKTEVSQLLDLIIHSLYSQKEIFLRELISNASDALDKLRFLTLTDPKYKGLPFVPRVDVKFDNEKSPAVLVISDTGIGMTDVELNENLGTIARSGTRRFLETLKKGEQTKDASNTNLIGQFGVGFYSCFMVADKVEVLSLRAGEEKAFKWSSNGRSQYEVVEAERDGIGTTVTLFLNEDGKEYASQWQIESLVKKYSNHIPYPIFLHYLEDISNDDSKKNDKKIKTEQINVASAIWKRAKSELTDDDYNKFYESFSHDTEKPLHYVHTNAEGAQEYTTLFYVPKNAPGDLYHSDYQPGVKLYVKRVFITDDEKELLPTYLRFVRGVIDSEDLPLNVSREILQQNRILTGIRNASVKKLLSEFKNLSTNVDLYNSFISEFGRPLKEGLYQDFANRDILLELVRFRTTANEKLTSLADYVSRMQSSQKAIYYITGERGANLRRSPLLEMYNQKNIEVLIMDDEIDGFVVPSINKYKEHELKSVNRSDTADDLKTEKSKSKDREIGELLNHIKKVLGNNVKDVKSSGRLSDSPSCIVADENDPTVSMQSIMKSMGQDAGKVQPILEINPNHDIVGKLKQLFEDKGDNSIIEDVSHLLLEQALLIEGAQLHDPVEFASRVNRLMSRAII